MFLLTVYLFSLRLTEKKVLTNYHHPLCFCWQLISLILTERKEKVLTNYHHPLCFGWQLVSLILTEKKSYLLTDRPPLCFCCLQIIGCAALGVGIWLLVTDFGARNVTPIADNQLYEVTTYLLIAGGGAVALLAFCGCCGTIREDKCVLSFVSILCPCARGFFSFIFLPFNLPPPPPRRLVSVVLVWCFTTLPSFDCVCVCVCVCLSLSLSLINQLLNRAYNICLWYCRVYFSL